MELRKPEAGPRQPPGPSLDGYGGNAATGTEKTASVRTAKRAQAGRLRTSVRRAIIGVLERAAVRNGCWANQIGNQKSVRWI